MRTIAYSLAIISWAIVGLLLVFLGRIAYFYEKTSKQRVGYWLLPIPGVLLLLGVILYLTHDVGFIGHPTGDVLMLTGGLLLVLFGSHLQELMTGERR
jgi:hypothetical protein